MTKYIWIWSFDRKVSLIGFGQQFLVHKIKILPPSPPLCLSASMDDDEDYQIQMSLNLVFESHILLIVDEKFPLDMDDGRVRCVRHDKTIRFTKIHTHTHSQTITIDESCWLFILLFSTRTDDRRHHLIFFCHFSFRLALPLSPSFSLYLVSSSNRHVCPMPVADFSMINLCERTDRGQ